MFPLLLSTLTGKHWPQLTLLSLSHSRWKWCETESVCMTKVWLTCVSTPGAWYWKRQGDLLMETEQWTNRRTDEQMKMERWRLKDEDGWMHVLESKQAIPFFLALTTGCHTLNRGLLQGAERPKRQVGGLNRKNMKNFQTQGKLGFYCSSD